MPIYKVQGPDRIYEVEGPPGATDDQVLAVLAQHLQNNPPPPPKGGFIAAGKAGIASLQQDMAGLGAEMGLRDVAGAQKDINALESYKQRTFAPQAKGWTETPWQNFKETLGGSLPYMAAPVALGVAGGPLGAVAGAGLAGLGSLAQFTGSNLSRQRDEGTQLGEGRLGAAAAAAVPQAALDVIGFRYIPGIRKLLGVSEEVAANIAKQTTAQVAKDYALSVGKAATVEGTTEAVQQVFERLQADLPTMDPEARKEYLENFIGGAVLGGTIAGPGRYVERGQQRDQQVAEQRTKDAETQRQQQALAQQEADAARAAKQTPAYLNDLAQRWEAASAQMQSLKDAVKQIPNSGEFTREDRADAYRAVKEFGQSDDYQSVREEFRLARPMIEQQRALAEKMQGQTDPLAGRVSPKLPPSTAKPQIEEVVGRLVDNPEAAQRVISGEVKIPGLTPQENRAVAQAIQLQWKQREADAAKATKTELAQRQADLQAAKPGVPETHDVSQFMDSTEDLNQATEQTPSSDLEYMNQPAMDDTWFKALGGDKPQPVPVAESITPQGDPDGDATKVDDLYQRYTAARGRADVALNAQERDAYAKAQLEAKDLRQQLDLHAKEGTPMARELVRLRDEQEDAVRAMLHNLGDVREGLFFGGKEKERVKGPDGTYTREAGEADQNKLDLADTNREGLIKHAQEAKQRYIRAALQEAATLRRARGASFSTDEAVKAASQLNDKFDEMITRMTAKRGDRTDFRGKPVSEKIAPNGAVKRVYTLHDPDSGGPVNITLRRAPSGKLVAAGAFFKRTRQTEDLLDEEAGKSTNDAEFIQAQIDKFRLAAQKTDTRPLEERPLGNVKAALDVMREDIANTTRELVTPKPTRKRVEGDLLKRQYPEAEAKKAEEESGESLPSRSGQLRRGAEYTVDQIDRALQRKDIAYGVRKSLEKAKETIEAGNVSGDLLDAAQELATQAQRGARVRDPSVMRDMTSAMRALADVQRDNSKQTSLPGMEVTSFERATPENFQNSPPVKRAREAIDAAKTATGSTEAQDKLRTKLETVRDAINNKLEGLRATLPSAEWLRTAFPDIGTLLKKMEPVNSGVAQRLGPEWVAAREKVAEDYATLVDSMTAANRESRAKLGAAEGTKERIEVLERQSAALEKSIDTLRRETNQVTPATAALLDQEAVRQEKIADIQERLTEQMELLGQVRDEQVTRLEDITRDVMAEGVKASWDKLNKSLAEIQQVLKATEGTETEAKKRYTQKMQRWSFALKSGVMDRTRYDAQVAEAEKELEDAEKATAQLRKQDAALQEQMAKIVAGINNKEFDRQAMVLSANEDENVKALQAGVKQLQKKLEWLRSENASAPEIREAMKAVAERRAALVKLEQQREASRVRVKNMRDAWQRKLVSGLGLEGLRHIDGVKEKIKSAEDAEKERSIREMQDQALSAVSAARRKEKGQADAPVRRAAGPVTREKVGGGKRLEEATREDQPFNKSSASDNEIAENLKGRPGTALRDAETRGKLETDRAARQGELVQMLEQLRAAKDPEVIKKLWGPFHAKQGEIIELDKKLEPFKAQDVEAADKAAAATKKKDRAKKTERKLRKAGQALNEQNANASRRQRAVEELEEDNDAFDDLSGFGENGDSLFERGGLSSFDAKADRSAPWHGKTLAEAAKWGRDTSKDPFERAMFDRLLKTFSKFSPENQGKVYGAIFNEKRAAGVPTRGVYDNDLNAVAVERGDEEVQTLLHELVHAATSRALEQNAYFASEVAYLLEDAETWWKKNHGNEQMPYGMTNVHEFLAEANSNPEFQELLSRISVREKKSLWTRFTEAVAKLFGIKNASLLTDVLEATEQVLRHSEKNKGLAPLEEEGHQLFRKAYPSAVVGTEPGKLATLKGNLLGLGARTQFVDALAAAELGIKKGEEAGKLDSLQAFQGHYFMRMSQQTTQAAGQFLTFGPVKIVKDKLPGGGTQERYEAKKGATMVDVATAVEKAAKAAGWDVAEAEHALTMLAIGQRANAVQGGWKRVKADDPAAAKAEYDAVVAKVNANSEAKTFLNDALAAYKQYNNGLIDFLQDTDTLQPQEAARLKNSPYVPFYRVERDEVRLFAEGEHGIRIGNIKDNPDLQQMLGDDKAILPIFTSAVQNTFMLSRMAMRNKATKETAHALHKAGFVSSMGKGPGPSSPDTVHYKVKGEHYFATIDSDMYGIPAHLIVKGMEGIKTMMPGWVRLLGAPANFLRAMVTRSPAYVVRQLIRDPVNSAIIGAVDSVPVANALKHMIKTVSGKSDEEHTLMRGLAVSSNIYTGDANDMTAFIKQIAGGQSGMRKLFNRLDMLALQADAATRASVYEDSVRKGLTEAEAQFRALEIQNFSRRGLSPTMQHLSTMIPFFNAQIQGVDVLYRALKGDMPFNNKLEVRRKLLARSMMLMATSLGYAAAMQDDEDYKKAKPEERYQNFFLRVPGFDDFVKIPIPFEVGILFKALPEAILDAMSGDTTAKEAAIGMARTAATQIPGFSSWGLPAGVAPLMQAGFGQTTWGPIETNREKQMEARMRYRENTSELAKALGEYTGELGISPVMLEHLARGYTGSLGLAALHMLDPMLEDGKQEASKSEADTPLVGGLFQRKEGRYLLDRAYNRMDEIVKAQKTYKELQEQGKQAEARQYAQEHADRLVMADVAGMYRQRQGEMFKQERLIRNHPTLSTSEKDALLKKLRSAQNANARGFSEAADRTARQ